MTDSAVPDVLLVSTPIWVLLHSEVSIASHEVTIQWALLSSTFFLQWDVLRLHHGVACDIRWGIDHSGEWLQIWAVVPLIAASESGISGAVSEQKAKTDRGEH